MILIYTFFVLILFLVLAFYFILKKSGYRKSAIVILSVFIIIVMYIFNLNKIDEIFYFKSNAIEDLKLVDLYLKDDFEIVNNKVIGFPERYQTTVLKISEVDKKRIISEIKKAKYFQEYTEYRPLYYKMNGKDSKRLISNYSIKDNYFKESYQQKKGYVAISEYVLLKENSNSIELNRIEE